MALVTGLCYLFKSIHFARHIISQVPSLRYFHCVFLPTSSRSSGFLLPRGFQFITRFGIRVSGILCTCLISHELSVLYFIQYRTRYLHNFPDYLICYSFELWPSRGSSPEIHICRFVVSLIDHISHLYMIILFIMALVLYCCCLCFHPKVFRLVQWLLSFAACFVLLLLCLTFPHLWFPLLNDCISRTSCPFSSVSCVVLLRNTCILFC